MCVYSSKNWTDYGTAEMIARFSRCALTTVLLFYSLPLWADITSYALVREDGTLQVRRHRIRLYGIHIPPTARICRLAASPLRCGPRAVLQLDFKIDRFVSCKPMSENRDGTIYALCRVDGEDLSAWMLERGWALALPDAPFEYVALERIARARSLGVWGTPVDVINRR